jgi:uncharacterized protein YbjQ (UPF0145 family)
MIVTTGNDMPGYQIVHFLGVVRGVTVRSPGIAQGFVGSLKSIVGGKIDTFTQVCDQARPGGLRPLGPSR